MAVACREEHVGGSHPKKIKEKSMCTIRLIERARCLLPVACGLWFGAAAEAAARGSSFVID
jgi:hypothetical protein